jgi:glycosyltransferase involved in cell wall biosynthesis
LLVDPSLVTAPYDAALDAGLREAGVRTTWAVRPVRKGDRRELPEPVVDEMFYRKSEKLAKLPRRLRSLAKGLEHVAGLFALARRVAATRPDVVHFQWLVVPWLDALAIAFLRQRVPVVVTVHDTTPWNGDRSKRLQTWGADWPLRLADKLIVHTRGGKNALVERGFDAERVAVIPHGPLSLKSELGPASRRTDGRWTFVVFGEIKPYKGVDVLVEAVGLLSDELRGRSRVVIAGRPLMDLEPIRARIRELGLEEVVEIRPRRHTEDEMAELFHAADCFLFPYRRIDASGVYFLVKSFPKWLIASNVGIFAEDLEDGVRGMLVPPEDPRALASAMTLALTLRYRPVGLNTDHDWQSIGVATRSVYGEARDRRARATWTAPAEALDGGNP